MRSSLFLALVVWACGSPSPSAAPPAARAPVVDGGVEVADAGGAPDAGPPRETGLAGDAGSVPDAGPDAGTELTPDAGAMPDAGTPDAGAPDPVTRFVAIGDTGKGNATQTAVAGAIETVCNARGGCDFALLLGDNIYPSGVKAVDDQQFQDKFEIPYARLTFPFHVALGNHDYGSDGAGLEFWKGQFEIDYTARSQKWRLPAAYYRFQEGPVDFFALDTNGILLSFGTRAGQERDVPTWIAQSTRPWKIAFGHHPYLSNGEHGNAGRYDGVTWSWFPGTGQTIQAFVDRHLCGRVDAYLCGHDHSLQDLGEACGTQFLVSGGGAGTTTLPGSNPRRFQAAQPGFLLVEATSRALTFTFFDAAARSLHSRTVTK
jgi:tartrate-resistant acid phosphatase type 5